MLDDENQPSPDDNDRPKSSWTDILSTSVQLGLFAIAIYGLFISSVGDRLLEALQGDISSAKNDLSLLRRERENAEAQIAKLNSDFQDAQLALSMSQLKLENQGNDLETAFTATELAKKTLEDANSRLGQLNSALDISRPALIRQRCQAILSTLSSPRSLEMRYRILPVYRWTSFRRQAQEADFRDYDVLKNAFIQWADSSREFESFNAESMQYVDGSIISQLDSQRHWAQFTSPRDEEILKGLKIGSPANFEFRPVDYRENVRNLDQFLMLFDQMQRNSESLASMLAVEPVEDIDPIYGKLKSLLRDNVSPAIAVVTTYIGEDEARSAVTTDEVSRLAIKQILFERSLKEMRQKVTEVCGMESTLNLLFD